MEGFKLKGAAVYGGRAGVPQILALMKRLADSHSTAAPLVAFARSLVQHLPQKDRSGEVGAVFSFVQDKIRYVRDPIGAEWLQAPLATLELQAGDCDDKSILLAALLNAIGYPTRFRAVGPVSGVVNHVFVDVLVGGEWFSLDSTEPYKAGWTPPVVGDTELSEVSGLGFSVGSVVKSVKKAASGIKKAVAPVKKVIPSPVKLTEKTLDVALKPASVAALPVVENTLATKEFQTYAPQAIKLVPVVGPTVGTAIQTAQTIQAAKAAEKAAEDYAAQMAEEAKAAELSKTAAGAPVPALYILGIAALAAMAAALLAARR